MMPHLNATVESETAYLEKIQASPMLGICFLDGRQKVELIEDDPALREAILEYYQERIRQLIRSERAGSNVSQLLNYPVNQD